MGASQSVELEDSQQTIKANPEKSNLNFLIIAFIHSIERELMITMFIPSVIINICSEFCARFDSWDLDLKHKRINITFGNTIIYHNWRNPRDKMQSWQSVFGKSVCKNNNLYQWTLRIAKIDRQTFNHWKIIIGVMKNRHVETFINWKSIPGSCNKFFTSLRGSSYAFIGSLGWITRGNSVEKLYSHQTFEKVDDTIKVILDLQKDAKTLSFEVNGHNGGIAYKVDGNCEYRLAVSICEGRYIQMIDSDQIKTNNSSLVGNDGDDNLNKMNNRSKYMLHK